MGTIKIHVPGGLGNQLFAYYSALYFSQVTRSKLTVCLDDVNYSHDQKNYDITSFNLFRTKIDRTKFATRKRLQRRLINGLKRRSSTFKNIIEYITGYVSQGELDFSEHETARFNSTIESKVSKLLFNIVNLYGYFQNCEFIDMLPPELRKLELVNPSEEFNKLRRMAIIKEPIMVHIRLGNYLLSPFFENLGVLHVSYYRQSLNYVLEKFPGKEIWIITNSLQNAKKIYPEIAPSNIPVKFIENQLFFDDPAESLILLTFGCAIVCSNSTFSIVSALVNPNNRIVVVPKVLYRKQKIQKLKYLKNWHVIENLWLESKPEL
jgi:hypothetical protein